MSPSPPVSIAIRFTYVLQDWQQHTWPQQPPGAVCSLKGKFYILNATLLLPFLDQYYGT